MVHRLAPESVADLDGIWSYIARESGRVEYADRLIDLIVGRFLLLAEQPRLGRARDQLRAGLRSFLAEGYVIFYRIDHENVVILRVLHSRRDIEAVFSPDRPSG